MILACERYQWVVVRFDYGGTDLYKADDVAVAVVVAAAAAAAAAAADNAASRCCYHASLRWAYLSPNGATVVR